MLINHKSIKMRKFFLLITLVISSQYLISQEEEPYLINFHYIEVSGNTNEFIAANKNYFKPLAKQAVKDGKWAGWDMFQSVTDGNKFLFIHHYNSPNQLENAVNVFSGEVAKKLGLKSPNWESFQMNGSIAPQEIWQIVSNAIGDSKSNYFIKNEFIFNDRKKFIDNNKLWNELVVSPQLGTVKGLNWACGVKLTSGEWEDGKMSSYNGISFDGFDSLEEILKNRAYSSKPSEPNKYYEKFVEEVDKRELNDFSTAVKNSIWRVIDNTWD
jgi:hypothetical protein